MYNEIVGAEKNKRGLDSLKVLSPAIHFTNAVQLLADV